MKKFLMSTRFNKQTPQDFGMTYTDGKFIRIDDGSEWIPCQLYDLGWGNENGFYKVPLGSFEELIQLVLSDNDMEDSYGAAAMILSCYPLELKDFLLNLANERIAFRDKKKCRKLNSMFRLNQAVNLTFTTGMTLSQIEQEHNDWKKIAGIYSSK